MNDSSVIFTEQDHTQHNKIKRKITTARVFLFTWGSLCLFALVFGIFTRYIVSEGHRSTNVIVSFSGMTFGYLLLGIWSIKRPFIPLLIAASINTFLLLSWAISLLDLFSKGILFSYPSIALFVFSMSTIVQFIFVYFLFRDVFSHTS